MNVLLDAADDDDDGDVAMVGEGIIFKNSPLEEYLRGLDDEDVGECLDFLDITTPPPVRAKPPKPPPKPKVPAPLSHAWVVSPLLDSLEVYVRIVDQEDEQTGAAVVTAPLDTRRVLHENSRALACAVLAVLAAVDNIAWGMLGSILPWFMCASDIHTVAVVALVSLCIVDVHVFWVATRVSRSHVITAAALRALMTTCMELCRASDRAITLIRDMDFVSLGREHSGELSLPVQSALICELAGAASALACATKRIAVPRGRNDLMVDATLKKYLPPPGTIPTMAVVTDVRYALSAVIELWTSAVRDLCEGAPGHPGTGLRPIEETWRHVVLDVLNREAAGAADVLARAARALDEATQAAERPEDNEEGSDESSAAPRLKLLGSYAFEAQAMREVTRQAALRLSACSLLVRHLEDLNLLDNSDDENKLESVPPELDSLWEQHALLEKDLSEAARACAAGRIELGKALDRLKKLVARPGDVDELEKKLRPVPPASPEGDHAAARPKPLDVPAWEGEEQLTFEAYTGPPPASERPVGADFTGGGGMFALPDIFGGGASAEKAVFNIARASAPLVKPPPSEAELAALTERQLLSELQGALALRDT